jgi:hypothetical protein
MNIKNLISALGPGLGGKKTWIYQRGNFEIDDKIVLVAARPELSSSATKIKATAAQMSFLSRLP